MEARQNLPLLIWAYARMGLRQEELFRTVVERLEGLLKEPSEWGICVPGGPGCQDTFWSERQRGPQLSTG